MTKQSKWFHFFFIANYFDCKKNKKHELFSAFHIVSKMTKFMRGSRKFYQSGLTFLQFLYEGREDINTTISGPSSARQRSTSQACRWLPNFKCWLSSIVIF